MSLLRNLTSATVPYHFIQLSCPTQNGESIIIQEVSVRKWITTNKEEFWSLKISNVLKIIGSTTSKVSHIPLSGDLIPYVIGDVTSQSGGIDCPFKVGYY